MPLRCSDRLRPRQPGRLRRPRSCCHSRSSACRNRSPWRLTAIRHRLRCRPQCYWTLPRTLRSRRLKRSSRMRPRRRRSPARRRRSRLN